MILLDDSFLVKNTQFDLEAFNGIHFKNKVSNTNDKNKCTGLILLIYNLISH